MVAAEKYLTSSHIAKDYVVIPVVRRYTLHHHNGTLVHYVASD